MHVSGRVIPNSQLPRLTQPSFTALQTPSGDVVQVSAGSKIKENAAAEKSGMSKGAKWALGLGVTALAAVAAHNLFRRCLYKAESREYF